MPVDIKDCVRGICFYTVTHVVETRTSGNELPGKLVFWDEFSSDAEARLALANSDDRFYLKNGNWVDYSGYTTATISVVTKHHDYMENTLEDCISCFENSADWGSKLCVGCQAYQDHTQ